MYEINVRQYTPEGNGDAGGGAQATLADQWRQERLRVHTLEGDQHRAGRREFRDRAAQAIHEGLAQPADYTDWFSKASVPLAASGRIAIPRTGIGLVGREWRLGWARPSGVGAGPAFAAGSLGVGDPD